MMINIVNYLKRLLYFCNAKLKLILSVQTKTRILHQQLFINHILNRKFKLCSLKKSKKQNYNDTIKIRKKQQKLKVQYNIFSFIFIYKYMKVYYIL